MSSLILALFLSILGVGAPAQDTREAPEANPQAGQRLFDDVGCYQCHGFVGQGGAAGARLVPNPLPFAAFSRYVRAPTGQMPPYTVRILPDNELADIYAYVESIPDPPALDSIPALNLD